MPRLAFLWAVTVEVCCPFCEEAQPDPDGGSLFWTVEQVVDKTVTCVDCERPFRIVPQRMIRMTMEGA